MFALQDWSTNLGTSPHGWKGEISVTLTDTQEEEEVVVAFATPAMVLINSQLSPTMIYMDGTSGAAKDDFPTITFINVKCPNMGGFPIGVILSTRKTEAAFTLGLQFFKDLHEGVAFHKPYEVNSSQTCGRIVPTFQPSPIQPLITMSDCERAELKALMTVFNPQWQAVCQFHVKGETPLHSSMMIVCVAAIADKIYKLTTIKKIFVELEEHTSFLVETTDPDAYNKRLNEVIGSWLPSD